MLFVLKGQRVWEGDAADGAERETGLAQEESSLPCTRPHLHLPLLLYHPVSTVT